MEAGARPGDGRRGPLSRLLGLAPVPVPPHVFEVDARVIRYGSFARSAGDWELSRQIEAELPAETFQAGALGGPVRAKEAFDQALETVVGLGQEAPTEASLVLPDRWLRLLFADLEQDVDLSEDILRFKLKKLVPFRVDDLRLDAVIVPAFPGREGSRLLYAFAIEQLVRDLEAAFQSRGVRIGQIASRSLYLISLLKEDPDRSLLVVNLETDGYSLCYLADGVPYVVRYRAASVDPTNPAQAAQVAQDLRILIGFLEEHVPGHAVKAAVVCGESESAQPWVEFLRDRFDLASRQLTASDLPVAASAVGVTWHRWAPLLAAASREVA